MESQWLRFPVQSVIQVGAGNFDFGTECGRKSGGFILVDPAGGPAIAAWVIEKVFTEQDRFVEVSVKALLEVCENRYVTGSYRKARSGGLSNFTGIGDPCEAPLQPEVERRTDREIVEENAHRILDQTALQEAE